MSKNLINFSLILVMFLTACEFEQEVILIDEPEVRLYETFKENSPEFFVADCENYTVEEFKNFYLSQMNYVVQETELRKTIQIQSNGDVILSFDPVVDSISLNSSYIMIIKDNYIKAISSNPTKYIIPETIEQEQIIDLEKQQLLNNKVLKKMSQKGKAKITNTDLYFDTQRLGKLIYTIKVDVETADYSYAEVFIYDGFSGDLID